MWDAWRRVERLEAAAREMPDARDFERVTVDLGDGYRIDVDVPAGTLAQIEKVYGEPARQNREA